MVSFSVDQVKIILQAGPELINKTNETNTNSLPASAF